jgi:hypothetical protein
MNPVFEIGQQVTILEGVDKGKTGKVFAYPKCHTLTDASGIIYRVEYSVDEVKTTGSYYASQLVAANEPQTPAQLAFIAVNYFLVRVAQNANIRYHCGAFTELYCKMRAAHMALHNLTEQQVDAMVFKRELRDTPAAKKVDKVKAILDENDGEVVHGTDFIDKLREAIC